MNSWARHVQLLNANARPSGGSVRKPREAVHRMADENPGPFENANTEGGDHVLIDKDPYLSPSEATISINGREFKAQQVNRFRDGGTTELHGYMVASGTALQITLPRRIGSDDRTPRIRIL